MGWGSVLYSDLFYVDVPSQNQLSYKVQGHLVSSFISCSEMLFL